MLSSHAHAQFSPSWRPPKYTSTGGREMRVRGGVARVGGGGAEPPALTQEQVEQRQQAEGHGHGQTGVHAEAHHHGNGGAEQQRQEDQQPGELEERLDLLACKGLHLI